MSVARGIVRNEGVCPEPDSSVSTPRGRKKHPFTKTEAMLLRYLAGETVVHGGVCCTKQDLASRFGRNVKTIDRCIANLRRRGFVETEMRFDESGAQISSRYRVVRKLAP